PRRRHRALQAAARGVGRARLPGPGLLLPDRDARAGDRRRVDGRTLAGREARARAPRVSRHLPRPRAARPGRPPAPPGRRARHLPDAGTARRARGGAATRGGRTAPGAKAGARMTPAVALWPGVVARRRLADYLALTKPRVIAMVLVTTAVGYDLGSAGTPPLVPLLLTLAGTALAAAGT